MSAIPYIYNQPVSGLQYMIAYKGTMDMPMMNVLDWSQNITLWSLWPELLKNDSQSTTDLEWRSSSCKYKFYLLATVASKIQKMVHD